jgi:hypothetical protein
MKISELYEAIHNMKHAARYLKQGRAAAAAASNTAKLVKLNKDGAESKMHDATTTYPTEEKAREYHARIVKLNPTRDIRHKLYVDGKLVGILNKGNLLESASGGGTSSGAIASVANPFGIVMRQPSLFGYVPIAKKKRRKTRKKHSPHK